MTRLEPGKQRPIVAYNSPETVATFHARRRAIAIRTVVGIVLVLALGSASGTASGHGVLTWLVQLVLVGSFLMLVVTLVGYINLLKIEWTTRRNPWVEWNATSSVVRVGPVIVIAAIVLTHPEWPGSVVRTLHPRRLAPLLTNGVIWGAGDPTGSMAVSPNDGSALLFARKSMMSIVARHRLHTIDG